MGFWEVNDGSIYVIRDNLKTGNQDRNKVVTL